MAGKRNRKKSKPRGKAQPRAPRASRPKEPAEALYAWAEMHGYWKTLLAVILAIIVFCFASAMAKHLFP